MCQFSFLTEAHFVQIAETFDEAFADYHLKSRASAREWLYNRGVKNAVQYDCSVGAFDGDRMVGFTLVGIDNWMGEMAPISGVSGRVTFFPVFHTISTVIGALTGNSTSGLTRCL